MPSKENHYSSRSPLVRASIMGANDGIISISGFMVGVISSGASEAQVLLSTVVALVTGALSMGAGEFISVSTQLDSEKADVDREKKSLADNPHKELDELVEIYQQKGLEPELASEVAKKLSENNPLEHHLREELGISEQELSRPIVSALISFFSFATGGGLVTSVLFFLPLNSIMSVLNVLCIFLLFSLGFVSSKVAGASPLKGALRVSVIGIVVLVISHLIGKQFL